MLTISLDCRRWSRSSSFDNQSLARAADEGACRTGDSACRSSTIGVFSRQLSRADCVPRVGIGRRMIGRTVGHYRVVEELGSGGMGVVYKAEDLHLARHVALKFLPQGGPTDGQALERFQREAQAASALNQPHICTIHDIDTSDGSPSS
jgi:serine/threonine protein kinase